MAKNQMEAILGLGSFETERNVPGTRPNKLREFCYVSDNGQEEFGAFFHKLVRYVTPPLIKNGGAILEGCKLTLPNGEMFQAISYKGDIDGWRQQIKQGAEGLSVKLAWIKDDAIVLNDIQSFPLVDCKVDYY